MLAATHHSLNPEKFETDRFHQTRLKEVLVEIIRFFHHQGWTPATSSNFSSRISSSLILISESGLDKGEMTAKNFLEVDLSGNLINPIDVSKKPSAETLLHTLVYKNFPKIQTVLHTHSANGTILSKLYETQGSLELKEFEILKAFEGIKTHETSILLPIFKNSQDMKTLSEEIQEYLLSHTQPLYGFLLAGHGLYTWGETPEQAKRHVEAFEFLFECILKLRSYGYADYS